jgi:DNA repair photolyase
MVAPIIPGINDSEIPAIVSAAARAGAVSAGRIVLRLPHGVAPLFTDWLERHFPDRAQKVLNRVRDMRGGRLYDAQFHTRMRGTGLFNQQIQDLFKLACQRAGIATKAPTLSAESFKRPEGPQLSLFPAD